MPEPTPKPDGQLEAERSHREVLRSEYPAWDRLLSDFFRPSTGQAIMAVVLCLVGLLVVMQVRAKNADDSLGSMRRTDLVQLLDQLNAEQERLGQ